MTWGRIKRLLLGKSGEMRARHHSEMTAANRARLASFREQSRFCDGVRWLATLDGNCCIACAALDGVAWDFEGNPIGNHQFAFQVPPLHANCRCVISPVPASLDEIFGQSGIDEIFNRDSWRASRRGPINVRSYGEFLRQQSVEFVEGLLGGERASMYINDNAELRDFVDSEARLLSIDEVRRRLGIK